MPTEYPIEQRIIDELCSCGHLKSAHGDTIIKGHGTCKVPFCSCPKFTFVDWVIVTESENQTKYKPTPI